jgi:hypothetical protein
MLKLFFLFSLFPLFFYFLFIFIFLNNFSRKLSAAPYFWASHAIDDNLETDALNIIFASHSLRRYQFRRCRYIWCGVVRKGNASHTHIPWCCCCWCIKWAQLVVILVNDRERKKIFSHTHGACALEVSKSKILIYKSLQWRWRW